MMPGLPKTLSPAWLLRLKIIIVLLGLIPFVRYSYRTYAAVDIDPVATITHQSGDWTLIFLLLTLLLTPLRTLGFPGWIIRLRRTLGLMAAFYALLHFAIYLLLYQGLNLPAIWHDVLRRPFITVGFLAWLMMLLLATTSTDGWMRRLKRHWSQLHRLVYLIAILGVLHYYWLVKRDLQQPILYGTLFAILLIFRLVLAGHRRWRTG